jgi:hypothetical protein
MERKDLHHVNMQDINVTIETDNFRISGIIDILINHSTTDELNNDKAFLEVRNADIILRSTGNQVGRVDALSLNKQCILALYKTP